MKFSKIGFPLDCFTADFSPFSNKNVKISAWVTGWAFNIKSKHFRGFLKIL